jgi:hypothetical protein
VLVGWDNGAAGGHNYNGPGGSVHYTTGGTVSCPDSTTNDLADTNLVVNITPGLSPESISQIGVVGVDPFAGQVLPIFTAYNTDLSAASSFANITIVGGTATVTIVPDTYGGSIVELSNIYSNPVSTPEPATMGLLVIGGLGMLLRNRRK